eukprot:SAG11_NODE_3_length_39220_cov_67.005828_7_plen_59_part_00
MYPWSASPYTTKYTYPIHLLPRTTARKGSGENRTFPVNIILRDYMVKCEGLPHGTFAV